MKSGLNPNNFKGWLLLILCAMSMSLIGQELPQIEARFANPKYDRATRSYYLDVELHSKTAPEFLFGMNLRFFYDASKMEFKKVDQFTQGYGILGNAPKPIIGNQQSGSQLFDFNNSAAYINGGIQLLNEQFPLEIPTGAWVKAFRLCFKVPAITLDQSKFCPSVIWDIEAGQDQGGFLPGSAGLVITVTENVRSTRFVSKPTVESGLPFNWSYDAEGGLPHGHIAAAECTKLGDIVATEDPEKTEPKGYSVKQNQPNPFDSYTLIDFVLPYSQHASIILFDVNGVVKEEIEGYYEKGKNQIQLKQKPWMNETSVIYYRLQTDNYKSQTFTMSLVRA